MSDNWLNKTAADLGRAIATGDIDPTALTETFLNAIEHHEFRDRIYARVTPDRARAEARAAAVRAKKGQRRSLLDGVPISWKDLFDSAGVGTEAGSALLKGRVPARDAQVLQNATRHGLVCLGKTHMSELAFSGLGYNPVTATPPSINDTQAVAGGSSSGAAASVAFGLAAAAVGSDTGGSVRIPAVWNDLIGLKTTSGRLSLQGVVPLCARFDTVGPLCRTVEDAAVILAVLDNRQPADLRGSSLKGARLLILDTAVFDDIADQPMAGFNSAVQRLQAAGAVVERREIACVDDALSLSSVLYLPEAYATWETEITAAPDKMFGGVLDRFLGGAEFSAAQYIQAWQLLLQLRQIWQAEVAGFDAVILPTAASMPPKIDKVAQDRANYSAENLRALRNTRIANLFGLPALSVPTGLPSTGIMFLTRANSERRLLRLGAAAEGALA